ncbi:hypothetical protein [Microvirga thermotolerans]|uniref:Uncharacterized protein n=1 Tax=Microvirga thermotolerans TaxID=2651334 RepID=A0A5P9JTL8_9HYPH|nr:hypothetical protein [Microvirga thermotolerans]QFU15763.1 hypothetical protein GDR74_05745 [Microvirga thermotolerans]
MPKRVALACLALAGALIAGGPAGAQPYGYPGDGDYYYDGPPPGPRYGPPRYRDMDDYPPPRRRGARGPWDCNANRCINVATGELWESTCNYRGCFPLRPARHRGYGW